MKQMNGVVKRSTVNYDEVKENDGKTVTIAGYIHRIREMTGFSFVLIRTERDVVQCVYSPDFSDYRWDERLC